MPRIQRATGSSRIGRRGSTPPSATQKATPKSTRRFLGNSRSFPTKFGGQASARSCPTSRPFSTTRHRRDTSRISITTHSSRACRRFAKICHLPAGSLHPTNSTSHLPRPYNRFPHSHLPQQNPIPAPNHPNLLPRLPQGLLFHPPKARRRSTKPQRQSHRPEPNPRPKTRPQRRRRNRRSQRSSWMTQWMGSTTAARRRASW